MPLFAMFYAYWYAPFIIFQIAIEEAIDPSKKPKLTVIRGGKA